VCERDDLESINKVYENYVVWKGVNRHLADVVVFHAGHESTNLRKSFD
jgi:hypothetical protein